MYVDRTAFQNWQQFLTSAQDSLAWATRSIPTDLANIALLPLTRMHVSDSQTIEALARWRDAHQYAYPTQTIITLDSTARWLMSSVLDNPNRILFLVCDSLLRPIGHAGLLIRENGDLELDNVLRGESVAKGAMTAAVLGLERWAQSEFAVNDMRLRVMRSNEHAIRFYESLEYDFPLESQARQAEGLVEMHKDLTKAKPFVGQILTAGPSISCREVTYVTEAAASGWNVHHSDYLRRFEQKFADYVGSEFAMATSSCTGALHLALLALGVGPGDEVIVPELTWVATASAVRYVGATPIFSDVDADTWCMDPASVESLITARTRAIMPVHLYGFAAAMPEITALAARHGIPVVEDAAPAIGTQLAGRPVGTFAEFGCFSFQGAKMLVTGEGGMLVTNDAKLFSRAQKLQDHGRRVGTFWIEELGYKYKMNNVTAAIGLAQVERSEVQIAQKKQIASWYHEFLDDLSTLTMQKESHGSSAIHWMNSVLLSPDAPISRDELALQLRNVGIDTRPVFPAISQYSFWDKPQPAKPVAKFIGDNALNLPSGVWMNRQTVERVAVAIRKSVS